MSTSSISPESLRNLIKELTCLQQNPQEDIRITFDDENMSVVYAFIVGPSHTPYFGGYFKVKIVLDDYPTSPPKCFFLTKIFHPNVSRTGEICVNTLKKEWKSNLGLSHILLTIKCLLIYPNPESALNEGIFGMLFNV